MAALEAFGPGIWVTDGPTVVAAAGFHYPTRMAVIRLSGGGLAVWSPVPLTDGLRATVDNLGEVRGVIAPNTLHDLFLAEWQNAYPAAEMHGAPGLAAQRKDLRFAGELGDTAPAIWAADLDQVVVRGNRITTEVALFHRPSGTVLFTDLLQQFPDGWFKGWRAVVARLDLMREAEPAVPRKFRVAFTDRHVARAAVGRILDWPAEKVIMAHGPPVEADGRAFLGRAFRWLMV